VSRRDLEGDEEGKGMMPQEHHWLSGFNFNVEERDAKGQTYEALAICRSLALARAVFAAAVADKAAARTNPVTARSGAGHREARSHPSPCGALTTTQCEN
jgi:hypothetical protein